MISFAVKSLMLRLRKCASIASRPNTPSDSGSSTTSEMFEETGCVPGSDGEEVPAETMVPDAKEYILETINDPEASYDPEIWDTPGFTLVLSWLAQKWQQKCRKLAPRGGNKNAVQYLTKEQQKSCLDSAAAELIREITQQRPLN
jgi:hypothetical protein